MTPPLPFDRATKTARDRLSRQRRTAKLKEMRAMVAALEGALPVVLTLDDHDVQWKGFLDDHGLKIRALMTQSLQLTKEVRRLTASKSQLTRLLNEHHIASRVLAGIIQESPADDWERDLFRWRKLTYQYFTPWTLEECQEEIEPALKEVKAFQWSTDTQTTGVSFLGWRDVQRVDSVRGTFQFEHQKTFQGFDIMDSVRIGWALHVNSPTYYDIVIGPRASVGDYGAVGHSVMAYHEVVQQVAPHIAIVRNIERYPLVSVDAHILYLVFLVKTENGYIMGARSIYSPDLMKATDGPRDVWPSNFVWMQWEVTDEAAREFTFRVGGSLRGNDVNYAKQWMFESLGNMLRIEQRTTGRRLITSEER